MAAQLNETWFQGKTHRFRIQVINERTGLPVGSLTGYTFYCTYKLSHDDADTGVFQLTLASGIAVVDNTLSIIEITIAGSLTSGASFVGKTTVGYLDVQVQEPDGEDWTVAAGRGTVRAPVTRAVV